MNKQQVSDEFFISTRHALLEVAAYLDRLDRAPGTEDYRAASLRACIKELAGDRTEKTRCILEIMSDPTIEPLEKAPGKGAAGAWPGFAPASRP